MTLHKTKILHLGEVWMYGYVAMVDCPNPECDAHIEVDLDQHVIKCHRCNILYHLMLLEITKKEDSIDKM